MRSEVKFNKKDSMRGILNDKEGLRVTVISFLLLLLLFLPFILILILQRENDPSFTDEHKRHAGLPKKAMKNWSARKGTQ